MSVQHPNCRCQLVPLVTQKHTQWDRYAELFIQNFSGRGEIVSKGAAEFADEMMALRAKSLQAELEGQYPLKTLSVEPVKAGEKEREFIEAYRELLPRAYGVPPMPKSVGLAPGFDTVIKNDWVEAVSARHEWDPYLASDERPGDCVSPVTEVEVTFSDQRGECDEPITVELPRELR